MKTIIVAGSTGAIGRQVCYALGRKGVKVVACGRNEAALKSLCVDIDAVSSADVKSELLVVDFANLATVKAAANEVRTRFETVDGIVFSVANFFPEGPTMTDDGHERMFTTNLLGPYLFLRELLSHLTNTQTSRPRIVNVIAPTGEKIDFDDFESTSNYQAITAFGRSKACNIALVGELARREAEKIISVGFDPGFVKNETAKKVPGFFGWVMRTASWMFGTDGSDAGENIATLLTTMDLESESSQNKNGLLYAVGGANPALKDPMPAMVDAELGQKVWEKTATVLGLEP